MKIANPIYDVVFKYLMNDNKVAKLLLSAILEKEIIELDFAPANGQNEEDKKEDELVVVKGITVYQLDFAATIRDENGTVEKVLIEIQKAQKSTDIMRFRKYLGNQYSDETNTYFVAETEVKYRKAIPLITIYFLGFKLDNITCPVLKVKRDYIDAATKEVIIAKEDFIESLTHDSYVIQIPYLEGKRRTELEILLSVFDQSMLADRNNLKVLDIDEHNYPEKYNIVIKRLLRAISEEKIRKDMDTEEQILVQFNNYEETIKEKDKTIKEKDDIIEELKRKLKNKI